MRSDQYNCSIDIAHTREEIYEKPGSLPKWEKSNINNDLLRRDITINAICIEILSSGLNIIDDLEGIKDIKNKKIRLLHNNSIIDDPTRLYRAIRYKSRFSFDFEEETKQLMESSIRDIKNISQFRKNNEIVKIINEENPEYILTCIQDNKIFLSLFPENFLNKLAYIDKDFWRKSELHTKIFFSLFDSNVKFVNDFISSLNYSKKEKKIINELFDLKNSIIKKTFVDDFVDKELISNIYHCL